MICVDVPGFNSCFFNSKALSCMIDGQQLNIKVAWCNYMNKICQEFQKKKSKGKYLKTHTSEYREGTFFFNRRIKSYKNLKNLNLKNLI